MELPIKTGNSSFRYKYLDNKKFIQVFFFLDKETNPNTIEIVFEENSLFCGNDSLGLLISGTLFGQIIPNESHYHHKETYFTITLIKKHKTEWPYVIKSEKGQQIDQYSLYLGKCYLNGIGVEKNNIKSKKYFKRSYQNGYPEAQYYLGYLSYIKTPKTQKNLEKSKLIWEKMTKLYNHPKSSYMLGLLYFWGEGVEKDFNTANFFFQISKKEDPNLPFPKEIIEALPSKEISIGNAEVEIEDLIETANFNESEIESEKDDEDKFDWEIKMKEKIEAKEVFDLNKYLNQNIKAYHSIWNDFESEEIARVPILPIRTNFKGPSPRREGDEGTMVIVEEAL
ncbi:activator of c kinase protein 1-related [Anaeramoeba flamelloides]|uniref:Activator of c kinase protein 1-related n=1 Tax=Anaeramoeba flamelloides TaxID=1746091 RepID=A0AAV7Z7B2_9EUKA|nr:activator of c kinase protein 1-related [Anaeramoeba flamelloides]